MSIPYKGLNPKPFDFFAISFQVLIKMLPSYFRHVSQHKISLVTKFFGVHCVKPVGGQKVYLSWILVKALYNFFLIFSLKLLCSRI